MLAGVLQELNPPPADTQGWLLEQLEASTAYGGSAESTQELLSTVLPGAEKRVGFILTSEEELHLKSISNLPLRFWGWTASTLNTSIEQSETKPQAQVTNKLN